MKKEYRKALIMWWIGLITILLLVIIWTRYIKNIFFPINNCFSWTNLSGTIQSGSDIWKNEKTIVTWFYILWKEKTPSDYPKIKLNSPINNIQLIAEIDFDNHFEKTYDYENSANYFFGLKFFLWTFDNWWYYNVYRKQNWWVGNSPKNNLFWAKPAIEIRDWATRYIQLTHSVPVAVDPTKRSPWYQFTYFDAEWYLNNNIWKEIPIWVYLSSTSEVKWFNLTYIKSLKMIYIWKKDAIEVIK